MKKLNKYCTKCYKIKSITEFYKSTGNRIINWCIKCCNKACNKYYKKNKDKIIAKHKLDYKLHPKKFQDSSKKWKRLNKERVEKSNRLWRKKNKIRVIANNLKIKYWPHLTWKNVLKEYNFLLKKQKKRCKICKSNKRRLLVDHCHKTNFVRGFLCQKCNTGIGLFDENIQTMLIAIDYINSKGNIC